MTGEISTYMPFILLEIFDSDHKVEERLFENVNDAVVYAAENNIKLV